MVKQLSSLDVSFLVKELKDLEKSRVDKIFSFDREEIYIQFHKSNEGKKILRVINGKSTFLASQKKSDETPSHLCTMLRMNLEGKFLDSIEQIKPERILRLIFKSKDQEKRLYIELFGKGNIILCDDKDLIIECLIKHKFKDRSILPKHNYLHPKMQYNVFELDKESISTLLSESTKDKLVSCLATELGLGGIISEEICLISKVDKNKSPNKFNEKEIESILKSIKSIVNKRTDPKIIYDDGAVDVVPADFEFCKGKESKKFSSFSEALEHYFLNEIKFLKKESKYEKQINELKRIIEEQETTLENFKAKEKESREKGEIVYNNYQLVSEILEEVNKAKEKHSWKDIKEKLKGHKVIKDVDVKDKKVVVEVSSN